MFGGGNGGADAPPDDPSDPDLQPATVDPIEAQHHAAMTAYWKNIGSVDDDVVTYLVNPMFQGAPAWPNTRQAYRVIRTDDSLILASDGLSDPFPADAGQDDRHGFGMETFIEVKGLQDLRFDEINGHWMFRAIENMAMNVAQAGGFTAMLDQHGVLSIELPIDIGPEGWVKPNGNIGALIDVPMEGRANVVSETPLGPVRIVPITILHPAEIDICASGGGARKAMSADLIAKASGHISDPARASLR